jgi:hypothetical protein
MSDAATPHKCVENMITTNRGKTMNEMNHDQDPNKV